jgi:hypothetical protein
VHAPTDSLPLLLLLLLPKPDSAVLQQNCCIALRFLKFSWEPFNSIISFWVALFFHAAFAWPSQRSLLPHPLFPVVTKNAMSTVHGSRYYLVVFVVLAVFALRTLENGSSTWANFCALHDVLLVCKLLAVQSVHGVHYTIKNNKPCTAAA